MRKINQLTLIEVVIIIAVTIILAVLVAFSMRWARERAKITIFMGLH